MSSTIYLEGGRYSKELHDSLPRGLPEALGIGQEGHIEL